MEHASAARALPIGDPLQGIVGRRRALRRRIEDRRLRLVLAPTPDRAVDRRNIGATEEWDALGAEALCMLHLSPAEVAAAVDRDLSMSASWLLHALGQAMDQR